MCTCTQKSKKPAGGAGNFIYVFDCTKDDGTKTTVTVTAGNDNEAKELAELECGGDKARNAVKKILAEEFQDEFRLILNTDYSTEDLLIVSFWGIPKWFSIQLKTIESIEKIGYGLQENRQFPLIAIKLKGYFSQLRTDLIGLQYGLDEGRAGIELPTLNELIKSNEATPRTKELSGAQWVSRYPGSRSIADLASPFQGHVQSFYDSIIAASGTVSISATLRPVERAFLMQTCYDIATKALDPADAGTLPGVEIEWVHNTPASSIQAASDMVAAYGIRFRPAYPTKHSDGTAIDMNITWSGTLNIAKADGTMMNITSEPKDNGNSDLQAVGLTYAVHKLIPDFPHWSDDGH